MWFWWLIADFICSTIFRLNFNHSSRRSAYHRHTILVDIQVKTAMDKAFEPLHKPPAMNAGET
jgi:hypothetical protein